LTVFSVALAVRLVVALAIYVLFDGFLFEDDTSYSQMAEEVVLGLDRHWDAYTHYLLQTTATFLYPLTALYEVFGPDPLLGQLFVALMGAATAGLVAAIARELWGPRAALTAGLLVALLPSQVLWSTLILKDAQGWMLLAVMGLAIVVALRSQGWALATCLAGFALALAGLAFLREHTMVVAAWAGVIALASGAARGRGVRTLGALTIAGLIPAVAGYGLFGMTLVLERGSLQERRIANAADAETAFIEETPNPKGGKDGTRGTERERPSLSDDTGESALEADIRHLPRGLVYVLLAPFPWESGANSAVNLARLETVIWYPMIVLALLGVVVAARDRTLVARMMFPLLAGAGSLGVYALTEGNLGTAYRHRGEFVWAVALFATAAIVDMVGRGLGRRRHGHRQGERSLRSGRADHRQAGRRPERRLDAAGPRAGRGQPGGHQDARAGPVGDVEAEARPTSSSRRS
jgi:hypothetical protein